MKFTYSSSDYLSKLEDGESNISKRALYFVILILLAPFRLFEEISKKIVLLGFCGIDFLLKCIILSTILTVISTLINLIIVKRIYMFQGFTPLVGLITSTVLCIVSYFLYINFIDCSVLDLSKTGMSTIDKIKSIHKSKKYDGVLEDFEGTIIDNPKEYKGEKIIPKEFVKESLEDVIPKGSTLVEELEDDRIDTSSFNLESMIDNSPKSCIDPLYKYEKDLEGGSDDMLEDLKKKVFSHASSDNQGDFIDRESKRLIKEEPEIAELPGIGNSEWNDSDLTEEEEDNIIKYIIEENNKLSGINERM